MSVLSRYIGDKAFYRMTLAVAVPIMLQNGITNFVSMLDNIMVGRVGTVEMTGVAVANQLMFVFMLCLFGAVSGAGIFGAQFYGKGDVEGLRYSFRFKLVLCAAITLLGAVVIGFWGRDLADLFLRGEGEVEDAVASLNHAENYLRIMLAGLIPTALGQCYASTLRETGETVLPMKAGIAAVLVNLFFNWVLIFGHLGAPALGVEGAALATIISRFVEMGILMAWTHRHKARQPFIVGAWRRIYIPLSLARRMLVKGAPLMINESLWAVGITVINQCYSTRGLEVVAATNISSTFWNLFSVTFMATGTAIGIIVGQQLGAGEFHRVRETVRRLIAFSIAISLFFGGVYALCAGVIPLMYNTTDAVRSLAADLMRISALMMPLVSFLHATYFTLRSGGKTGITFLFDSGFQLGLAAPVVFLLSRFTDIGILPLYFICQSLDIVKCVMGYLLLKKGVWIRRIVEEE